MPKELGWGQEQHGAALRGKEELSHATSHKAMSRPSKPLAPNSSFLKSQLEV